MPFSHYAMNKSSIVYAIPAQNGLGSGPEYIHTVFNISGDAIVPVPTPLSADLGQNRCVDLLKKTIEKNPAQKAIIHATSQGTATALNYLAHYDDESIAALILEAPLASGNSAIIHTLKGPLTQDNSSLKTLAQLPGAYYTIPYGAKIEFPSYWPAGKQAIKSAAKISSTLPIILVHAKNDPQISYDDTLALYYALRSHGNNNVYLISKDGSRHINLLTSDRDKKIACAILGAYDLLETHEYDHTIDLLDYQPAHESYKNLYEEFIRKEKNHERIAFASCIAMAAGLAAAAKAYLPDISV